MKQPNTLLIVTDQERQRDWLPAGVALRAKQRLLDTGLEFTSHYTNTSCAIAALTGVEPDAESRLVGEDPHELVDLAMDRGRRAELLARFDEMFATEADAHASVR